MSQGPMRAVAAIAAAGFATAVLLVGASPATAGEFGEHVSSCAQAHGFSGEDNPGMHRGITEWVPHVC